VIHQSDRDHRVSNVTAKSVGKIPEGRNDTTGQQLRTEGEWLYQAHREQHSANFDPLRHVKSFV
jgi:hypothetical protein